MSGTVIYLAPDEWRARVVASADKRWPGASVMRVRCVWRTKKGDLRCIVHTAPSLTGR